MTAIRVEAVSKQFRLVHERNATLKAMVMRGMKRVIYDELLALDNVSFDVPAGKTFGLIGSNGSGKSTLLKCMARIYRPDSGSIEIDGKMSALLELGAGFHPELSGRENVYLNGSILGLSRRDIDRKFDEIVAFAGLERFIDHPVKNYSSGMFVRLGFSVAINVEPDVLLVDEVLAVGDEQFQRRCLERFDQLRREGRTVVVVTHSLDTVRKICDEAAWLDDGVLRSTGPATEVVYDYLEKVNAGRDHAGESDGFDSDHASVTGVDVLLDGRPSNGTTMAGAPVALRVGVELRSSDAMRVALHLHRTSDLVHVAASSTALPPAGAGHHELEFAVPTLDLKPGEYSVSVIVTDERGEEILAKQSDAAQLLVEGTIDLGGVVDLGGSWTLR